MNQHFSDIFGKLGKCAAQHRNSDGARSENPLSIRTNNIRSLILSVRQRYSAYSWLLTNLTLVSEHARSWENGHRNMNMQNTRFQSTIFSSIHILNIVECDMCSIKKGREKCALIGFKRLHRLITFQHRAAIYVMYHHILHWMCILTTSSTAIQNWMLILCSKNTNMNSEKWFFSSFYLNLAKRNLKLLKRYSELLAYFCNWYDPTHFVYPR